METIDDRHPSSGSRSMLAAVATAVSGLLLFLQFVMLLFFPWYRHRMDGYLGSMRLSVLHPIIVWVPLWILILAIIWWSACRKFAPRRQLRWLALFLGLSLVGTVWGLMKEPPPSVIEHRAAPILDDMPKLPLDYRYR